MTWEVTKQVLAAFIRWSLAAMGAWFVKRGIIDPQTADAWMTELTFAIAGAVLLAIPFIWKILNARFNVLALIKAVQTEPPADTEKEIKAAVKEAQAEASADPRLTVSV